MKSPATVYEYCQAYEHYFFAWEDEAGVLAIPNGPTICYREFLVSLIESLSIHGVPSLGTLLLTMIATSGNGSEMLERTQGIVRGLYVAFYPNGMPGGTLTESEAAFSFLKRLSKLPQQYLKGSRRQEVLQTIFGAAHNVIAGRKMKSFIRDYKEGIVDVSLLMKPVTPTKGVLHGHLQPLYILNSKFPNEESLLRALASVPEIEDIPFQPVAKPALPGKPRDFIEALEANVDTFHIASLVRHIWSGLAIPFHSNHPSVQPLGGVSDLSNKGELDKLLISEYANEDILFLSRLANGEALYINRETPPETDKLQRVLLIDSSLQTWGTPRALAYAVSLAIARHPKTDIACTAYAVGSTWSPVLFSTVHELIDSLRILNIAIDASLGVESFLQSAIPKGRHEVILLTSPQGLKRPALQKVLQEQKDEISYCITASEDGIFSVTKRSAMGLRHLQTFTLPLKELWKNPPPGVPAAVPVMAPEHEASLPSKYPILFPSPKGIKQLLTAGDDQTFAVTTQNAILQRGRITQHWNKIGWTYLRDRLPEGNCKYEIGKTKDGEYILLCFVVGRREVQLMNLNRETRALSNVDSWMTNASSPHFFFWEDGFIMRDRATTWKFSLVASSTRHLAPSVRVAKEDIPEEAIQAYNQSKNQQPLTERNPAHSGTVLKNIRRVFINSTGHLIINAHKLVLYNRGVVRFSGTEDHHGIQARAIARNMFEFPDGSTIAINRDGMLILESSNKAIPTIYIPSVLDIALGLATKDSYAGAEYFNPVRSINSLEPAGFFRQFIEPFTDQIQRHAAATETN